MVLPEEAIKEFIQIYKKNFGVELTFQEATDKATRVFLFFKMLLEEPNLVNQSNES